MAGIFGNTSEDRTRERELNRYLDAQFSVERDEQHYQDVLDYVSEEILSNRDWLFTLYDESPERFMDALVKLFNDVKIPCGLDINTQRSMAFTNLRDTLKEMAKSLQAVQRLAEVESDEF